MDDGGPPNTRKDKIKQKGAKLCSIEILLGRKVENQFKLSSIR